MDSRCWRWCLGTCRTTRKGRDKDLSSSGSMRKWPGLKTMRIAIRALDPPSLRVTNQPGRGVLGPGFTWSAAFAVPVLRVANRVAGPSIHLPCSQGSPFYVLSIQDSQCRRRKAAREQEALQWQDPWQAPQFHRPGIMRMMHSRRIHENVGTTLSTSFLMGPNNY
jgi:hypothetical protein